MIHNLKIQPEYFNKVMSGEKTFEIRFNDRNYAIGDILNLYEYSSQKFSGKKITVRVVYILDHGNFPEGIPEGYVVMSIIKVNEEEVE